MVRHDFSSLATTAVQGRLQRDTRVDALRGLCLVVMTCDHLPIPNPWNKFTFQTFGFVSAAETFVFLSGMVTSWVYGRTLVCEGVRDTMWRALKRVRVLYFTHMALFSFLAVALMAALPFSGLVFGLSPWKAWLLAGTFRLRPTYLGNILPMYCFFIAAAPLALKQMQRGRTSMVMLTSTSIWAMGQFSGAWVGGFNLLAWQLLFTAGLIVGFPAVTRGRPILSGSRPRAMVAAGVAAVFLILRHGGSFHVPFSTAASDYLIFLCTDARTFAHPLRLINFAALAYLIWMVPRSFEEKYGRSLPYAALSLLGRHSLQVFAWSTCIACSGYVLRGHWSHLDGPEKTFIMLVAVASLFFPALLHESTTGSRTDAFRARFAESKQYSGAVQS